jgi:uncharacterized spore protein YtfJ
VNANEILSRATDTLSVKRVFGEPYQQNGVTIVPVAKFGGGGGGGGDNQDNGGAGFGLGAGPAGAYVIRGDDVRWEPAVDVNAIVKAALMVATVLALVARSVLKARFKYKAKLA